MAEFTFPVTAGVAVRGQFRRAIKEYCFSHHYKVDIDEDKGFLESLFTVTIHIPDNEAQRAASELNGWLQSLNTKGEA